MAVEYLDNGNADGIVLGQSSSAKIAFYNATPATQPTNANQAAITDGSGGTANATTGVAVSATKTTYTIPVATYSGLANGQTLKVPINHAFTVTGIRVRPVNPPTTASKLATVTCQINGVAVTGGVVSMTTAGQAAAGTAQSGTAITAANAGNAGQTLEAAISSVTAFVEGNGVIEFDVVNTDIANAIATILAQTNRFRTDLVAMGLIKGS